MPCRKSKNEFIEDAIRIHGNKYDYSLVKYVSSKQSVKIICLVHGIFRQIPNVHINKKNIHGCPNCGIEQRSLKRRLTKEVIVEKIKQLFPKYDTSYIQVIGNNKEKLKIICPIHGEFRKSFNAIQSKSGCPKCGRNKTRKALALTQREFKERAGTIHNNKYNYSLLNYRNKTTLVKIICSVHGVFNQLAGNHLNGAGCKKCALEIEGYRKSKETNKTLIDDFRKVHKNKYDYSKLVYEKSYKKVKIICKQHGVFWQSPNAHKGGSGCPVCKQSKGERIISHYLEKRGIEYIWNKSFIDCRNKQPLPFDFYIISRNLCIEYDGELHYKKYANSFKGTYKLEITQKHDKIKTEYCIKKSINLIRIPYWKKNNIADILDKKII